MPSQRVVKPTHSPSIYDVVGVDSDEKGFIRHAGLAKSGGRNQDVTKMPVLDMGPPLHGPSRSADVHASVVGSATLTDDEEKIIRTFIDRHSSEHAGFQALGTQQLFRAAPKMYCIHPHVSLLQEADGRYARTRFSCAGFVYEAYKKARITLLDLATLPEVEKAIIDSVYRRQIHLMEKQGVSEGDLGLEGEGPWPVLFCGYLFHSLNRGKTDIRSKPYKPDAEDRTFL